MPLKWDSLGKLYHKQGYKKKQYLEGKPKEYPIWIIWPDNIDTILRSIFISI